MSWFHVVVGRRPALGLVMILIAAVPAAEPVGPAPAALSIEALVEATRSRHPLRLVLDADHRAAAADLAGARAWENPEIEVEAGRARGRDGEGEDSIGRVSVSQPFTAPRLRSRRIAAAATAGRAVAAQAELTLLDLAHDVRMAALSVEIGRRAVALARDAQVQTAQVLAVVTRRVAAGESPQTDQLRVTIEDARASQASADGEAELAIARARLEQLCGPLPAEATISLPELVLPELSQPAQDSAFALAVHPRLLQLQAIADQRRAELAGERAAGGPSFSLGAFAEREADTDSLGVAIGVELPLWNRNRPAADRAAAGIARAEAELAIARAELDQQVLAAAVTMRAASARWRRFRDALRPAAQEAQRLALLTYQNNETGILDLLDARRTAQEIDEQTLDAERQVHAATFSLSHALGLTSRSGAAP